MNFIKKKLKEKSTYVGLAMILGVIGLKLSPEQYQAIGAIAVAAIAAFEVFRNEA
ncbi:MAG: hypothetical protein V3S42_04655 [Candidatus Neomarinimicrobiota bacterium]